LTLWRGLEVQLDHRRLAHQPLQTCLRGVPPGLRVGGGREEAPLELEIVDLPRRRLDPQTGDLDHDARVGAHVGQPVPGAWRAGDDETVFEVEPPELHGPGQTRPATEGDHVEGAMTG